MSLEKITHSLPKSSEEDEYLNTVAFISWKVSEYLVPTLIGFYLGVQAEKPLLGLICGGVVGASMDFADNYRSNKNLSEISRFNSEL